MPNKDSFNKMVLLTFVKVFGIVFAFIIPMYLGRTLAIETYGTYKQVMLFFWFSQVALNLGVDDSAYFYLRRDSKNFPLYSFNAMIFNLVAMGLFWLILVIFNIQIAKLINNASLAEYLPVLGYLILSTVASMQLEGILIGLNRFKERLMLEMGMEIIKSLAILVGFVFFNSIMVVLYLLSTIMTLRLIATLNIIHNYKKAGQLHYKDAFPHFKAQLKFGLPLGLSRILQNILNLENLFVSSFFSIIQYTIYAVGCFENPLINAARVSLFELANIELVDAMKHNDFVKALQIWRSLTRKLFLIIIPFVTYIMFFAYEIIVLVFSDKYIASVPFFIVFNIYILVGALNPEPLFRATLKTHMALRIRTAGVIAGLILIVVGAYYLGPIYALIGKIIGIFTINITGLIIGAGFIKARFKDLFNWKELIHVTLLSLVLTIPLRLLFSNLSWHPFWILAASFSIYLSLHFLVSCYTKLIKDDEIEHLKSAFLKIKAKINL
ncbi:MAG: lipopolysaccharide biosynthesis protein [Bacteriovoracaceae bacterium]